MPGKPHRKGKYSVQSKKQGGPTRPAAVVPQPVTAQVHQASTISSPQASPKVVQDSPRVAPARPARGVATMAKPSGIRYEFVGKELRTIGVLAGVMLILLVVLARVLA